MTPVRLLLLVLVLVAGCTVAGSSSSGPPRPEDPTSRPSRTAEQPAPLESGQDSGTTAPRPRPRGSVAAPRSAPGDPDTTSSAPSSEGASKRSTRPRPNVTREVSGWWAWAILDRRTGQVRGSPNRTSATTSTESMVKAWLVADYLAMLQRHGRGPTAAERSTMSSAIRVSDNDAADQLYWSLGGDTTILRMISTCGLTGSRPDSGTWSLTQVTAYDAATLGDCLADGTVAGPRWTPWLLREMRNITGSNAFGIREAFPPTVAAQIAVKNGWTPRDDGQWHVSCLGVRKNWSLAVLVRYPAPLGRSYGAAVCRDVARQLFD